MVDVALFPIPNSVNFPWVPCPLHVFEPRYRKMVHHCLQEDMLVGVCHTQKLVHSSAREQTIEEALHSNQATYKPCAVFSAGPVQLLQELEDGRLLIQVDTRLRLQLRREKQTLPFSVWACEELSDEANESADALAQCQAKILHRLVAMTHTNQQAQETLQSEYWQAMPADKFSFAVAGLLAMEADLAQHLLEMTSAQRRLETVLDMLNGIATSAS